MTFPFTRALVTGASSGIGREMVVQLLAAGVPTVAVARRRDRLDELSDAGRRDGVDVEVLVADLTSASGRARVAERLRAEDLPVDLLVNNAGAGTGGRFHETDPDRLTADVQLNVLALTQLSREAAGVMVGRGRGWILNVGSIAGYQPVPDLAVYAATKAYVSHLTEALHVELAGTGVVATVVCPGLTRTEFQQVSGTEAFERSYPDAVWSSVHDVAAAALRGSAAGRAVVVPGALNRGVTALSSVTPRWIARRVAAVAVRTRPQPPQDSSISGVAQE